MTIKMDVGNALRLPNQTVDNKNTVILVSRTTQAALRFNFLLMELSTGDLSSVSESEDQRLVVVSAEDSPAASPAVFCWSIIDWTRPDSLVDSMVAAFDPTQVVSERSHSLTMLRSRVSRLL